MEQTPNVLPGHEHQTADINCPSCGRFVGALTRCPHCGARVAKRMSVRVTRYAALILGILGVFLLYLMSVSKNIPTLEIGDIEPTMNFAYVKIVGVVNGDVRIFKQGERVRSLKFFVDDGTGELPVTAFKGQANELIKADRVPRPGDRVEVSGSLSVAADDNIQLRLQVPEHLTIIRAEAPAVRLADISADQEGQSVLLEARIVSVMPPREGTRMPWKVLLEDASGKREMNFWEDIYTEIEEKILLAPGSFVRVRANVDTYRGKPQLKLARGSDLEFPKATDSTFMTAGPGAPSSSRAEKIAVSSLGPEWAGKTVSIAGTVASVKAPEPGSKAPFEVVVKEGEAEALVVYWDAVDRRLGNNKPVVGGQLQVEGLVNLYKEKLQVKVNRADQIRLIGTAPASVSVVKPGSVILISSIRPEMARQTVTVKGTLGEPESLRGGVKYPLSDSTGSIALLLWDSKVPGAQRDVLQAGVKALVTGVVGEYKGELQIVPDSAQSIQIEP